MLNKLEKIQTSASKELEQAKTPKEVEEWLSKHTGRKSSLSTFLRGVKDLKPEERVEAGRAANHLRDELAKAGEQKLRKLKQRVPTESGPAAHLDITWPGIPSAAAKLHPTSKEMKKVEDIFTHMGFEVWDPYLVDDDYHNFTSLNIPEGHPARDMWDTLRINDDLSLIVHTSSMQHRIISSHKPPIRAIVPGKCFRHEATDARHEHSFFQVEGVYVDRGIRFSDMIGTLKQFLTYYFGEEMPIKIQPTFFPFVEPGLEILMQCPVCKGAKPKGCEGCGGTGWMEVIPCGPIHPFVIKEAGLDPEVYSGFAWGFGLDRLIMIKTGIDDVRAFHSGKIDFVEQF